MSRTHLAAQAVSAIIEKSRYDYGAGGHTINPDQLGDVAHAILDAVLPRITTTEELERLPDDTILTSDTGALVKIDDPGKGVRVYWVVGQAWTNPDYVLVEFGPLTAVWRPETTPSGMKERLRNAPD